MSASVIARWNLDLAAWALGAGFLAAVVGIRLRLSPEILAVLGGLVVIVVDDRAPWWLLGAFILALVARVVCHSAFGIAVIIADALALTAVIAANRPASERDTLLIAGTGAAVVILGRHLPGRLPAVAGPALVAVGAGVTWLCVPDTELIVVVGMTMVGPLVARMIVRHDLSARDAGAFVVPALALVWAAGQGFTGRPGGLPAIVVIIVAIIGWAVVDRWPDQYRLPVGLLGAALGLTGAAFPAAVAARTIGLRSDPSGSLVPAIILSFVAVIPWWLLARWTRTPSRPATDG